MADGVTVLDDVFPLGYVTQGKLMASWYVSDEANVEVTDCYFFTFHKRLKGDGHRVGWMYANIIQLLTLKS